METPIADFVRDYAASGAVRYHMPGHKGRGPLGCEALDITEIAGADALYGAQGIIAESERNASRLFGTASTIYSAEGSSLCIRTMLHLALTFRCPGCSRTILAARNVHHAFISAAALLDFPIQWLWPADTDSLCACRITPQQLEKALCTLPQPPAAVYLTSPDYLGNLADIRSLAEICHRHSTYLLVDQAHGAYLHFLPEPLHAIDLGADLCCDSAHKTLPVLTGGAYLHFSENTPETMRAGAKRAMLLFGSTSPSYLILQSLDLCNRYLADELPAKLPETIRLLAGVRKQLTDAGWDLCGNDPLRITVRAPEGCTGEALADLLRARHAECEYADPEYLVLMITPENTPEALAAIPALLGTCPGKYSARPLLALPHCPQVLSPREAAFRADRMVCTLKEAVGHVCGSDAVSCPPCVPIAVSGERITGEATLLMARYGIRKIEILTAE